MNFENKILSKEIGQLLYNKEKSLATAESCTGGRVAEAIIAVPGASNYFKGGIVAYTDEVKADLLSVNPQLLEEKGAVSEEVAREMVKGVISRMKVDYAIAVTGYAGPGGGKEAPVGTIWLACGDKEEIETFMLSENNGRDVNLAVATNKALHMFHDFLVKSS